jgi:hypothetical protein
MQQLEVVFGSIPTIMNGAKANYDTSGRLFAASDQRGMLIRDKKKHIAEKRSKNLPGTRQ